jgi:hypothetical protein
VAAAEQKFKTETGALKAAHKKETDKANKLMQAAMNERQQLEAKLEGLIAQGTETDGLLKD